MIAHCELYCAETGCRGGSAVASQPDEASVIGRHESGCIRIGMVSVDPMLLPSVPGLGQKSVRTQVPASTFVCWSRKLECR